jgi:hypothetical protein
MHAIPNFAGRSVARLALPPMPVRARWGWHRSLIACMCTLLLAFAFLDGPPPVRDALDHAAEVVATRSSDFSHAVIAGVRRIGSSLKQP